MRNKISNIFKKINKEMKDKRREKTKVVNILNKLYKIIIIKKKLN